MNVDACEPLVIHCLTPVMRPSRTLQRSGAGVGAGLGLGEREGGELAAGGERRHVALDLVLGAVGEDRQRARARVHRDRHADTGVGARELLEHEHVGEEVGAGAAVSAGTQTPISPSSPSSREAARAGSVCSRSHAGRMRRDPLVGEAPRELADLPLLVVSSCTLIAALRAPRRRR